MHYEGGTVRPTMPTLNFKRGKTSNLRSKGRGSTKRPTVSTKLPLNEGKHGTFLNLSGEELTPQKPQREEPE